MHRPDRVRVPRAAKPRCLSLPDDSTPTRGTNPGPPDGDRPDVPKEMAASPPEGSATRSSLKGREHRCGSAVRVIRASGRVNERVCRHHFADSPPHHRNRHTPNTPRKRPPPAIRRPDEIGSFTVDIVSLPRHASRTRTARQGHSPHGPPNLVDIASSPPKKSTLPQTNPHARI